MFWAACKLSMSHFKVSMVLLAFFKCDADSCSDLQVRSTWVGNFRFLETRQRPPRRGRLSLLVFFHCVVLWLLLIICGVLNLFSTKSIPYHIFHYIFALRGSWVHFQPRYLLNYLRQPFLILVVFFHTNAHCQLFDRVWWGTSIMGGFMRIVYFWLRFLYFLHRNKAVFLYFYIETKVRKKLNK